MASAISVVKKESKPEWMRAVEELAPEFAKTYPLRDKLGDFPYEEVKRLKQSGLMKLMVPAEQGGYDASFEEFIEVVMTFAAANPSIAHIFIEHSVFTKEVLCEAPDSRMKRLILREIVEHNALITNAAAEKQSKNVHAWETTFEPTPNKNGVLVNGKKFFCTGALGSEFLFVGGMLNSALAHAWVPTKSEGLTVNDDWHAMGMRGTGSGSVDLKNVFIPMENVAMVTAPSTEPEPASFFAPMFQTAFSAIYAGTARGAFNCGVEYVKTRTRPWTTSGVSSAIEDPYILQEVGRMRAYLSAAELMVREAARLVDHLLELRGKIAQGELGPERNRVMVKVAEAKLVATEAALRVCMDVFKVCGARSSLADEDMDRFLRDARTLTLHDPLEYKAKMIGEYILWGRYTLAPLYN